MPALLEFCANGFQDAEVVTATRAALTALEALTALPLNAETRRGARARTREAPAGRKPVSRGESSGVRHRQRRVAFGGAVGSRVGVGGEMR